MRPLALLAAFVLAGCQPDDPAPVTPGPTARHAPDAAPGDDDQALRSLGIPIAVPGILPEGAARVAVATQAGGVDLSGDDLAYYWLHYRAGDACFAIEGGVLEGLGGPGFEFETDPIAPPAGFAAFSADLDPVVRWNGPSPEEGLAPSFLRSDELTIPGHEAVGYTLTSNTGPSLDPGHSYQQPADCAMLDPDEARRVLESLTVLEGTRR